jgi:hypothetical protein
MDREPTLSLCCVLKGRRRERTDLPHHTLSDARELANRVLGLGNGLDAFILDLNIPRISGYAVLASYSLKTSPVIASRSGGNNCSRSFGGSQWTALM